MDGNFISYGFRSLTGIGYDFIQKIIEKRPFTSLEDFLKKTEPNKAQAVSLIKAGAFRKIDNEDRKITLLKYAKLITPKRKNLTITQIPMLIEAGLLDPSKFGDSYRIYEFNRYVKAELHKTETKDIILDQRGIAFLDSIGKENLYEYKTFSRGADYIMDAKLWAKTYDKAIEPIRKWLKENKKDLFESLRVYEMVQKFSEFGEGSIPAWEMEAMSFYYTEHELAHIDYEKYNISTFRRLSRTPIKEAAGRWFRNKTYSIIGTVIGKNKVKGSIDLLTPEGDVVLVKMYKGEFSYWDKQISERQADGSKKVVEKSWFQRGNKLFLHGYRRDDQFIPKTYSDSLYPNIALIVEDSEGEFKLQSERVE